MESFFWGFRTHDNFDLVWPIAFTFFVCYAFIQSDFWLLLINRFARRAFNRDREFRPAAYGKLPTGVVVIPSLLRNDGDFDAIVTTLKSCATNEYPSDLVIVASVDGRTENPELYAKLGRFVTDYTCPSHVCMFVTGNETRHGKMMAVETGLNLVKDLVAADAFPAMPDIYFSIDGDGTLGPHALELMAARLSKPHPLTGNPRRIVSGKICIRPDVFWQGWRALFTSKGMLYMNVAREFVVSNVARHNWKPTPMVGVPGALYCCWSDLIVKAPYYMGFMKTLRFAHVARWWVGLGAPKFSESTAPALPEALTGASDDTCLAFLASIATWKDGQLSLDAPATPAHAFGRLLWSYFFERSHDYEPEARVYTFTPGTWKGLWTQRVRWNASRFECAGRFWRSFWFHWEIGFPVSSHLMLVLHTVLEVTMYYVLLPYACVGSGSAFLGFVVGYVGQTLSYTVQTAMALLLEREHRKFMPVLLCIPVAAAYLIAINFFGCVYGVTRDLLFFGNVTNFAPEHTLMKSGCERVALTYRIRRFVSLCVRSALHGDVPLGGFWFGWTQTQWTPSGFEGWTTGKKPRIFPDFSLSALRALFAPKRPVFDVDIRSVVFRPNLDLVANRDVPQPRPSDPPPPASERKVA